MSPSLHLFFDASLGRYERKAYLMTTAGQLLKISYFSDFCCVSDRTRLMEPFDGLHRGQAFSPALAD